jgi:hypothetical protein
MSFSSTVRHGGFNRFPRLRKETHVPRGSTAFHDAMGPSICRLTDEREGRDPRPERSGDPGL